jgi:hypothetical protein
MKIFILIMMPFFTMGTLQATEKIWMPLGQPEGQLIQVIQGTPNPQGTEIPISNPTEQPTETVVPGVTAKDGHWIYKYANNHPESEGDYSVGKKEGVWKYYRPDGSESREIEFKDDAMTGNAVLWAVDGNQKYFDHLTDVIQKVVPPDFKLKTLLPYWVDLQSNGNYELLAIARSDTSSLVLVLDPDGNLLDSKVFDGLADDFIFGEIKKGGPVCFGYDSSCDSHLGVCQWEFDLWDGSKIKTVLQYEGWYGNNNPFVMPVFQEIQGQAGIVTDNETFQWNETQQTFNKVSNKLLTPTVP